MCLSPTHPPSVASLARGSGSPTHVEATGMTGVATITGLERCVELNGLVVTVHDIRWDSEGSLRYIGSVPPQSRCPGGRPQIALRKGHVLFNFLKESRAFGFWPFELMAAYGATEFTEVCALRFRNYCEPPTKEEVKLFFGPNVYEAQRKALMDDSDSTSRGSWKRVGAMFRMEGVPVKDGIVFTTGEKGNQINPLTQLERQSTTSSGSLWWPALIAPGECPEVKIVRCWEQGLRHSKPWWTPSPRCHEFDSMTSTVVEEVIETSTVQIEEVVDDQAVVLFDPSVQF